MTDGSTHIDYELIAAYLAGEADAKAEQQVEEWLAESDSNKRQFDQMKLLWEHTGRVVYHEEADVNVDSAWVKFKSKTTGEPVYKEKPGPKGQVFLPTLLRLAAAFVLGVAVYFAYNSLFKSTAQEKVLLTTTEVSVDTLSDGSVVSLNAHSKLRFPDRFDKEQRVATLQGEAFFQAKPDPERPFVVKVDGTVITVLGTSFYVKAYDSLNVQEVGVEEGRVQVFSNGQKVILEAGEYLSIDAGAGQLSSVATYNPNDIYWKSKTLSFQNESLSSVFQTLDEVYNIAVEVENDQILNCRLTGKFQNEPADRVFDIIATNFNLTYERSEDRFVVSGSGCE